MALGKKVNKSSVSFVNPKVLTIASFFLQQSLIVCLVDYLGNGSTFKAFI